MKDPHFERIRQGLEGELDTTVFEDCVVALLQEAYPTLVPIRGGQDAGMDGAIADGEGEAYPLVVTTAQRVERNLQRSLASYLARGGSRRKVVVATSRALTPRKRQRLLAIAEDAGFTLVQVHDQSDLADRLYRDSEWTFQLLGIRGAPRTLSAVPLNRRPLRHLERIGRDQDLQWLRETSGDRLLVGQPGMGKTYLLHDLVEHGGALFLVEQNEERLAQDLRDLQPGIVLVDDAHLATDFLVRMRQMRSDLGTPFEIVAATWPGGEADVSSALGTLDRQHVRHLALLTLAEIVAVLRQMGITLPDDDPVLGLLVDQSANKPGLAVVLGDLWLRGETLSIATGRALSEALVPSLRQVLEEDPTIVLACFALGGGRGMPAEVVREFLDESRPVFWRRLTQSAQGGVLSERQERFVVLPEALRYALLQEVFFSTSAADYRPLFESAPEPTAVVETLARARLHRVSVPEDELQGLIERHGNATAWEAYALCGEPQARWVLERHTGDLEDVAAALLQVVPRLAVRRLLEKVADGEEGADATSSDPYRLIQDWVQQWPQRLDQAVERRQILVGEVEHLHHQGCEGDRLQRLLQAGLLALSPRLSHNRLAVTGDRVVWGEGNLSPEAVPEIVALWERLQPLLGELSPALWASLSVVVRSWTHPRSLGRAPEAEDLETMQRVGRQILASMAQQGHVELGLGRELRSLANPLGVELDLPRDALFDLLFPLSPATKDWREESSRQELAAAEAGAQWARRNAAEVAARVSHLSAQARRWGGAWPGEISTFYRALAREVDRPAKWLAAFLDAEVDSQGVYYLLERVLAASEDGWEGLVERCLESAEYHSGAVTLVLTSPNASEHLSELALRAPETEVVENIVRRGVSARIASRLLEHSSDNVARAALIGEWLAAERGEVRPEVWPQWRNVLLSVTINHLYQEGPNLRYWFGQILHQRPDLAFDWLRARLEDAYQRQVYLLPDGAIEVALAVLASPQREELLQLLKPGYRTRTLLRGLIAGSPEIYRQLLNRQVLRPFHLVPLEGRPPDAAWSLLARHAIAAGYDAREVADRAFWNPGVVSGWGIEFWGKWETAFQELASSSDPALCEVARHGLEIAQRHIDEAREKQRAFELTGRFF